MHLFMREQIWQIYVQPDLKEDPSDAPICMLLLLSKILSIHCNWRG
jgi:hypothetical protein